jgi:predicted aspartyl protease
MFKQALAAFIALSGLSATAQAQAPVQAPTCAAPAVADTMDLQPVAGTDLVTVPVEINGTPKQFLLDIGTDHTEISQSAAAELKLPGANQSNDSLSLAPGSADNGGQFHNFNNNQQFSAAMMDVGGSRSAQDYAARVRATTFKIGDATGQRLQLIIANDKEMGKSEAWDGRMTGDFFAQYDIDLDFGGKKLSFMSPTNCTDLKQVAYWAHSEVAVIPLKLSGGKMVVPVMVGSHALDAVIETGSVRTVMRRDIAENLGLSPGSADVPADGNLRDGLGQQVYVHTFPQISFGGVTASNVPVRIQTNSMVHPINRTPITGSRAQFPTDPALKVPNLAIGMDVLHQLHLYAAFGQDKLYVTAAQ